jgi:cell division protein FtsW (lipid II flippase)
MDMCRKSDIQSNIYNVALCLRGLFLIAVAIAYFSYEDTKAQRWICAGNQTFNQIFTMWLCVSVVFFRSPLLSLILATKTLRHKDGYAQEKKMFRARGKTMLICDKQFFSKDTIVVLCLSGFFSIAVAIAYFSYEDTKAQRWICTRENNVSGTRQDHAYLR